MKLIRNNGETLTVHDVGPSLYCVRRRGDGPPVKYAGPTLVEDTAARAVLTDLRAAGYWDCEAVR